MNISRVFALLQILALIFSFWSIDKFVSPIEDFLYFFEIPQIRSKESMLAIAFAVAFSFFVGFASPFIENVVRGIVIRLSKRQRIFVSFSLDGKAEALSLKDMLESQGARVWLDEHSSMEEKELSYNTISAIKSSNTFVAVANSETIENIFDDIKIADNSNVKILIVSSDSDIINYQKNKHANYKYIDERQPIRIIADQILSAQ